MKKDLEQKIKIPEGIEINVSGNEVIVKGKEGELKRKFDLGRVNVNVKDKELVLGCKKATKVEKRMMNTIASHIKNMIKGVQEKFEYKLKIAFSHFPMTIDIKDNLVTVKNFLGEKIPRIVKIPKGVEIEATKTDITLKGIDKELVGQAAANFELKVKVPKKDRRIFQDGIYITSKAGVEI